MKKFSFFLLSSAVLFLCGCASSDRMARMSGGILDEYSAPPDYRLRSAKFQKKTQALNTSKRANSPEVAGLDNTLINIWPFFFRNDSYWSALWPLIDCDEYGFAIRPLYVQDGDEHSILFPLSGWNPENKDGWILNFAWNKNGFGCIPLCWHESKKDHGWFYYTPFLIHNYDTRPMQYPKFHKDKSFTEIMLFYRSNKTEVLKGEWDWLFCYYHPDKIKNNSVLNYHFAKIGKPAPETLQELQKIQNSVFAELPEKQGSSTGFFPLADYTKYADDGSSFYLFPFYTQQSKNSYRWNLLFGALANYENHKITIDNGLWASGKEKFSFLPLLMTIETDIKFRNTGTIQTLRKLQQLDEQKPFSQNLPQIKELLKELDPSLKLPETVVDYATLHLFLKDWWKGKEFPVEISKSGGSPFFYIYNLQKNKTSHIFPILLTGYEKKPEQMFFWSLPLLTLKKQTKHSGFLGVLPPFGYMDITSRNPESYKKLIHASNAKTAAEWNTVEEINQYFACGLFYRGKIAFNVAKQGIDSKLLEEIRKNLNDLSIEYTNIRKDWKFLEKERERTAAWNPGNKIEHYKKLIREEELKIRESELKERETKFQAGSKDLKQKTDSIQFEFSEQEIREIPTAQKAIQRLVNHYTELRWKEDIGNGIIFHKEKYYNGDYNWNFLGFLANGEKVGSKENTQILHLIYRHRKDNSRSETLFFPFVSIQKDGKDSQFSFLWRVFQLRKKQGKTSGYICFIPF